MPPMDCLLPMSVAVSPPEVIPPTWRLNDNSRVFRPMRAAWIAAVTPAGVPP